MPLIPTGFSLGDLSGAARGALGFSRGNRLRQDMARTLALYREARELQLTSVAKQLEGALEHQAAQLLYISEPGRPRKWDWGQFIYGAIIAAIFIGVGLAIWRHVPHPWWAYILAIPYVFVCLVAVIAALSNLLERKDEPPTTGDS